MIATIRNRELGIVELLSLGWNVFINNLGAILMIIFLIDLPVILFYTTVQTLIYQEIDYFIRILFSIPLCLTGMAVIFIAERYILSKKNNIGKL